MAIPFPSAFPPIVIAEIIPVTTRIVIKELRWKVRAREDAIILPAVPEIIPQISPTTSLQNEDTLSEFFLNFTATSAPFILLEFIEWKGASSAVWTETPTISKIIPTKIKIINIKTPIKTETFGITVSDKKENKIEMVKATIVIFIIQE